MSDSNFGKDSDGESSSDEACDDADEDLEYNSDRGYESGARPPSPSTPPPEQAPEGLPPISEPITPTLRCATPKESSDDSTSSPGPTNYPVPEAGQAASVSAPTDYEASRDSEAMPAVTLPATTTQAIPGLQNSNEGTGMAHTRTCLSRIRKAHLLHLNACDCGVTITDADIQQGDNVMKCRVPGCETVWVRCLLSSLKSLAPCSTLVSHFISL